MTQQKKWKLAPSRKIQRQLGSWYLCVLNIKEGRMFNGLPPGSGDASDPADAIILIDKSEEELARDGNYEMVYEVFQVPETDIRGRPSRYRERQASGYRGCPAFLFIRCQRFESGA